MSNKPGVLSKARLQQLRSLLRKKERNTSRQFLVEGWSSVAECLQSGWTVDVVVVHEPSAQDPGRRPIVEQIRASGVQHLTASLEQIQRVSATEHNQGILAIARMRPSALDDVLRAGPGLILCLDAVTDPGNAGTLVRSADWFGASAVLFGKGCVSLYNEKVVRASMGSLFHLPIVEDVDLPKAILRLRELGYHAVGADANARSTVESVAPKRSVLLVLGNEAHGLSKEVGAVLDERVAILRIGKAESLNVAVAGSVILSRLARPV